jgi:hypothetical protein
MYRYIYNIIYIFHRTLGMMIPIEDKPPKQKKKHSQFEKITTAFKCKTHMLHGAGTFTYMTG